MPQPQKLALVALETRATPALFTVTTNADNGNDAVPLPGSLRAAIVSANTSTGLDTIAFAIPGTGVQTIAPLSALPTIIEAANIDATSQTGYAGNPLIRLSGVGAGTGANGFNLLNHTGSTIRGFAIGGFGQAGVRFSGVSTSRILGSFIGTTADGTAADPNQVGILLDTNSAGNTLGNVDRDRLVVSGNRDDGIQLLSGSNQNTISVSTIGTKADGATGLANGGDGIQISGGAGRNVIGGTAAGSGNLISGNGQNGIRIADAATGGNTISGNRIGLSSGGSALANGGDGIRVDTAAGTTANPAQNTISLNTISQNSGNGVSVRDGSRFVRLENNSIFDNAALGITLLGGSNDGLAAPVIKSATSTTTGITVAGTITGKANTAYVIGVFSNATADPSGFGEGRTPVGTATVTTAGDGTAAFSLTATTPSGRLITATVTNNQTGDTSSFSQSVGLNGAANGGPVFTVGAGAGRAAEVNVYKGNGAAVGSTVTAFDNTFTGGVRTAAADFNNDGTLDIVVGTGPGVATRVRILSGVNQNELFAVSPFEASFTGGVYVAVGDITSDGRPDLIITPDEGGGPRVDVYSGNGFGKVTSFFGIDDPNFRGGARAAVGDINGDGTGDLLVAAGFGGGPRVAGFSGKSVTAGSPARLFGDFFAFEQTLRNGVFIAAGDLDGDGKDDMVVGGGPGGGPRVTAFSGADLPGNKQTTLANFFAGDANSRGGVRVASRFLDGDNRAEVVTGSGDGAGSRVDVYDGASLGGTPRTLASFDAFSSFTGGVFVG